MNSPIRSNSQDFQVEGNNTEFERYLSLINTLKGFEEYTLDINGVIVSSNLEAINITGYEEWEVIGKKISIFYPIEDQLTGKPSEDLAKTAKRGYITFTSLWTKKRNSFFLARIKIKSLNENGVIVGYKMTLQDATHKAVTNHRIKKIKDEYLSLFNNSFVGILKFTMQDYDIFMMNDKAEKIMNSATNRMKIRFDELFEYQEDFSMLIKMLVEKKKIEDFQFIQKGALRWLMVSLRYFSTEKFAEGTIIDITELKKKDKEIVRLTNELDQFLYHASHELRSPLSSILGLINLVKMDKGGKATLKYVGFIEQKILQLDQLLSHLVAIGLNNKKTINKESINWKEIVDACLKDSRNSSNIRIDAEISQSSIFQSDSNRIKIILRNLVSNAIKYYNPNLEAPLIKIEIHSNETEAKITISDNGVGIDEKHLKKIFEMFYKAHIYDGSGLGLYTVKIMVDRLGGKINAKSNPGSGSVFTLMLPNTL